MGMHKLQQILLFGMIFCVFFTNPRNPMIFALDRLVPKEKNMNNLVNVFGESHPLWEVANMALIMGNQYEIGEV